MAPSQDSDSTHDTDEARAPVLKPGARVDSYELVRLIGKGGMGMVWESRHIDLNKRVAIKTLKPSFLEFPEIAERFTREARAASAIHHDNVVSVTDVGTAFGVPFMVMDFLAGEPLSTRIERDGAMPIKDTLNIVLPILSALAHTHDQGIVHRDIKPDNIFLQEVSGSSAKPMLLDFGISKAHDGAQKRLTMNEGFLGTPHYAAPEQASNPRGVDARADLFSIGVVMYECVSGRAPFDGETALEVLMAVASGICSRLDQIAPHCPRELADVVHRAIRVSPDERFATAREFGEALLPWAGSKARARYGEVFGEDMSAVMHASALETKPVKAVVDTHVEPRISIAPPKKGMPTAAAIGLGAGAIAIGVAAAMFATKTQRTESSIVRIDDAPAPEPNAQAEQPNAPTLADAARPSVQAQIAAPSALAQEPQAIAAPSAPAQEPQAIAVPRATQQDAPSDVTDESARQGTERTRSRQRQARSTHDDVF